MTDTPLPASRSDPRDASIFGPRRLTQALVAGIALISCVIFWYAANRLHVPEELRHRGSLLQSPPMIGGLIAGVLLLGLCTALGTLIVGKRWHLAGLLTATGAFTTWAARGGSMLYVLLRADSEGTGRGIFITLLIELLILFAAIAGIWQLLWMRHVQRNAELLESRRAADEKEGRTTGAALLAQIGVMALVLLLLAVTPQKKQVLAAMFIAGIAGTAAAEAWFADRFAGRWYWVGPLVIGAFGYLAAYVQPAGMNTGNLSGAFSAFAHALPLDYASMGCAGALLGYWMSTPETPGAESPRG